MRDQVNVALEQKRQEQVIKANLSARVRVVAGGEVGALLSEYESFLPTLFGVSQVDLLATHDGPVAVEVDRAEGVRCERCWRYVPSVSDAPETLGLCSRCVEALAGAPPAPAVTSR